MTLLRLHTFQTNFLFLTKLSLHQRHQSYTVQRHIKHFLTEQLHIVLYSIVGPEQLYIQYCTVQQEQSSYIQYCTVQYERCLETIDIITFFLLSQKIPTFSKVFLRCSSYSSSNLKTTFIIMEMGDSQRWAPKTWQSASLKGGHLKQESVSRRVWCQK